MQTLEPTLRAVKEGCGFRPQGSREHDPERAVAEGEGVGGDADPRWDHVGSCAEVEAPVVPAAEDEVVFDVAARADLDAPVRALVVERRELLAAAVDEEGEGEGGLLALLLPRLLPRLRGCQAHIKSVEPVLRHITRVTHAPPLPRRAPLALIAHRAGGAR